MDKFRIIDKFNSLEKVRSNWTDALERMKSFNPNDNNFYMLSIDKGTEHEYRTRFLSYQEAIDFIQNQIDGKK